MRRLVQSFLCALFAVLQAKGEIASGDGWTLSDDGVLTVEKDFSYDYEKDYPYPWRPYVSNVKKVVFMSSVTRIGDEAFSYCSALTSVEIPNGVTLIGASAFEGCGGLTSVEIPSSAASIGGSAFYGCNGMMSVEIPSSVTSIGSGAFADCSGLESIKVDKNNSKYDSRDNCNAIIVTSDNELIAGCKNTIIPNNVVSIGHWAFSGCSGLTGELNIPSSVIAIGDNAFNGCGGLTGELLINSNMIYVGEGSFWGCSGLEKITVDKNNAKYDSRDNCNAIIESKTNKLIAGCMNSTIPSNVTSIGKGAFGWCMYLKRVEIPSGVTSIGDMAFWGCSGLERITVDKNNPKYDSREDCNAIIETETNKLIIGCKNTIIPNGVVSIGTEYNMIYAYAFEYCTGLTSITVPSSVESVGTYSFSGCVGLESIIVDANNLRYDSRDDCNAIIETTTNTLVVGCKNTKIPSSVTIIGHYAFDGCSGLTGVEMPSSVTSIGWNAFRECSGLTGIEIPSSVTSIGRYAFCGSSGLTKVVSLSTTPQELTSDVFEGVHLSDATLYVPKEAVDAYKAAEVWKDFGTIVGIDVADLETAKAVVKEIEEIGEVTYTKECKGKIETARGAYDKLTEVQKGLVTNYKVLTDAEEKYRTITSPSAVKEVRAEQSESWYEMSGRKLAGKPTRKGVYVHNGKLERVK